MAKALSQLTNPTAGRARLRLAPSCPIRREERYFAPWTKNFQNLSTLTPPLGDAHALGPTGQVIAPAKLAEIEPWLRA